MQLMAIVPMPDSPSGGYVIVDTSVAVQTRLYDNGVDPASWFVVLVNNALQPAVRGPFGSEADAVAARDGLAATLGTVIP